MDLDEQPEFGDLLRRYRHAAGLNQEELAERSGLSTDAISLLERGERRHPHRYSVQRLAEALELAPADRSALVTAARRRPTVPVGGPGMAEPAARTPSQPALPRPLTPLIGREHEVAAVASLLARPEVRLLTLTGPGGVGKTRLALQVATGLVDAYADGVHFVSLAPLTDAGLVPTTIARALGLREAAGQPLIASLRRALRTRKALLLLDSFEHLPAAAPMIADLLATCPGLSMLITSRAPLHVRGEQEFAVQPLALPDLEHAPPAAQLVAYAALSLFLQRARAIQPEFQPTAAEARVMAEICARLDGLPLAIELAAAWVKLLPLPVLLARLGHRLALLQGGARDLPARQRTMRATVAWSYELLGGSAQVLFARLAVFAGGWTLEAAELICGTVGELTVDVLQDQMALADKSLLRTGEQADGAPRFSMLETVRAFALELLAASAEAELLRRQHAMHYTALAEQGERQLEGPEQPAWVARLEREHDNLRAALIWVLEGGAERGTVGLRLAGALWRFWYVRGYLSEGRRWLELVLAAVAGIRIGDEDAGPTVARARALHGAGALAYAQGDYERATALQEESLALFEQLGDRREIAACLNRLGLVAARRGEYERAAALHAESLALKRELGDRRGIALSLDTLGIVAHEQGEYGRATALHEESLVTFSALGDTWGIAMALGHLGDVARDRGDWERAAACYEESLELRWALSDRRGIAACLEGLAQVAASPRDREGDQSRTVQLLAAAATLRAAIDAPLTAMERPRAERAREVARTALGVEPFAAAWAAGEALSMEAAVTLALTRS